MYYKCHKVNLNRGGSYKYSPGRIKSKKAAINPINKKYYQSFQYTITAAYTIKLFTNKYEWEGINFPSEKDDWKKFEKNNVRIALYVLYPKKEKYISCLCFKT